MPLKRISPGQAVVADQCDGLLHRLDRGPGTGQLGDPGVTCGERITRVGARRQAVDHVNRGSQRCLDLADSTDEPR